MKRGPYRLLTAPPRARRDNLNHVLQQLEMALDALQPLDLEEIASGCLCSSCRVYRYVNEASLILKSLGANPIAKLVR